MYPHYLVQSKVTDFFTLFLNLSDKISTGLVLVTVNTCSKHKPAVIWNTGEILLMPLVTWSQQIWIPWCGTHVHVLCLFQKTGCVYEIPERTKVEAI